MLGFQRKSFLILTVFVMVLMQTLVLQKNFNEENVRLIDILVN